MPDRRRVLDQHLLQLESAERRATRQVAAAYNQARAEIVAALIERWNPVGVDTPADAAARLRQLALLDQIDARLRQLEREAGIILRGVISSVADQGVEQVRRELALLPKELRPENTLTFATINEQMVERYVPPALDGLRVSTTDLGVTLRRELQAGLIQGEAFPNLVRRLMRSVPEGEGVAVFPRARTSAELATRRAVITAENGSKVAAIGVVAEQVPLMQKQAMAVAGPNTTDCCLRVHGQIQPVDQPFELVGEPRFADRLMHSPFHWNCRTGTAMYHPAFEESLPTSKLRAEANAELERRKGERKRRDESAAGRRTRQEREAVDRERAADLEQRQAEERERQRVAEERRQAEREAVVDVEDAGDDLTALRERMGDTSETDLLNEIDALTERIRAAEDAGDDALTEQLSARRRVYFEEIAARRATGTWRGESGAEAAERRARVERAAFLQTEEGQRQAEADRQAAETERGADIYQPSEETLRVVREYIDDQLERFAPRVGPRLGEPDLTPEQLKRVSHEAFRELVKDRRVAIQFRGENIADFLADGRYRTQFETGMSGATLDQKGRAAAEKNGIGIPRNIAPALRPVYGYVDFGADSFGGGLEFYGDIAVVLKPEVRRRSTVTAGDSFAAMKGRQQVATPIDDPAPESLGILHPPFYRYARNGNISSLISDIAYIEVQIQGGVSVDDIDFIRDPRRKLSADSLAALAERGIRVIHEIEGEPE